MPDRGGEDGEAVDRIGLARVMLRRTVLGSVVGLGMALVLAACSSGEAPAPATTGPGPPLEAFAQVEEQAFAAAADPAPLSRPTENGYLLFNQQLIEGFGAELIDLGDPDAVFGRVFAELPDQVTVFPSENYYYFILNAGGRQVWGNIRLPAGDRENGILSFGYFEFIEFPTTSTKKLSGSKFFGPDDGVTVTEVDRFTYTVGYLGKTVRFDLHQLDQSLPTALVLDDDETFVQRTFDESGYQFYLVFNEEDKHFLWVLNEEVAVPDVLDAYAQDLLIGRRSGFAFWIDAAHGGRKVLAGVRQLNIRRNDYYDGPFDQLADNYADETRVSEYMQAAYPSLSGRIDKYGYYTDRETPIRVALSTYYTYASVGGMLRFVAAVREHETPRAFIARGGREVTPSGDDSSGASAGAAAAVNR